MKKLQDEKKKFLKTKTTQEALGGEKIKNSNQKEFIEIKNENISDAENKSAAFKVKNISSKLTKSDIKRIKKIKKHKKDK